MSGPRRRCPGAVSSQGAQPGARSLKTVVHVHVYDHERCDDVLTASKGRGRGWSGGCTMTIPHSRIRDSGEAWRGDCSVLHWGHAPDASRRSNPRGEPPRPPV